MIFLGGNMTEKRFGIIKTKTYGLYVPVDKMKVYNFSSFESELDCIRVVNALNDLEEKSRENGKIASKYLEENEQLKKFESTGEHIRLSINIETGELQRHIYATGQWFGDFDRVLVKNWIDEDNYQRFVDRVIEVYNNEFKKELQE